MKISVKNKCLDFTTYRAARVKSLFNPERGDTFELDAEIPDLANDWQIGVVVGPSGTGKSSIGRSIGGGITDLYADWPTDAPIVEAIAPKADFNVVTGALAAVGLGDVPAWLRPFHALSNGQQFRAGLARALCDAPDILVVDEFTSVIDRQIAKIGALAFSKSWRRLPGKKVILLSCHYDILEWIEPDWVFDTGGGGLKKKSPDIWKRPRIELEIWKVNQSYWQHFKPHYYLDLPMPIAAEYFIGTVDGELVAHLAVSPRFNTKAYRATRLVVMPEWQGAGVGTKFLNWVCAYHKAGSGRCGKKFGTYFHTSHPQLCQFLKRSQDWKQVSAALTGTNKAASAKSIIKSGSAVAGTGYGGHFRAIQGFKYIGKALQ